MTATTTATTTYWEGNGKHQEEYDRLKAQIPECGAASQPEIESLRVLVNTYHDYHNNGWQYGVGNLHRLEELAENGLIREWIEGNQGVANEAYQAIVNAVRVYRLTDDYEIAPPAIVTPSEVIAAHTQYFDEALEALADLVITAVSAARNA